MKLVKTNRSIITYILLSILTFGIYGLFFIHSLADDVNTMCRDDGKTTSGLLVFLLLSVLTCGIYSIIWWYGVSERVGRAGQRRGLKQVDITGGTFLLWYLVGILVCQILIFVGFYKLFDACNSVGNEYNTCVRSGIDPFVPAGAYTYYQQPPMNGQWQ